MAPDEIKQHVIEKITEEELKALTKEGVKEATQEWLNDMFAKVGKWTVAGLMAILVAVLLYAFAWSQGWRLIK